MKPGTPPLQSIRLLDQVRERIRYLHYSLKMEKAYLHWVRFFIRWNATQPGGMRHPRDMGKTEIEAFLWHGQPFECACGGLALNHQI